MEPGPTLPPEAVPVALARAPLAPGPAHAVLLVVARGTLVADSRHGVHVVHGGHWLSLEAGAALLVRPDPSDCVATLLAWRPAAEAGPGTVGDCGHGLHHALPGAIAALVRGEPGAGAALRPLLLDLLQRHRAGLHALESRCPGATPARRRQFLSRLQRVRLHMHGNLDRHLLVPELARLCSVSPWYFLKAFRRVYGTTPLAALTALRLERAVALLRAGELGVAEVGRACGFDNHSAFSRAFRRHLHCAPRDLQPQAARS